MFGIASLALAGLMTADASAATGLSWQWSDGQTRSYLIQTQLQLAQPMLLRADNNTDIRISEVQMSINTACTHVGFVGKKSNELKCNVADFAIRARPYSPEAGRLQPLLDEFDTKITSEEAHVMLVVTNTGRVKAVDLEGFNRRNERTQDMHEAVNLLLTRAFSALDLELPAKGDDKGRGTWRQKENLIAQLPSAYGTMGAVDLSHTIKKATEDGMIDLESIGRGTMAAGETVTINGTERPRDLYDMNIGGLATFDAGNGMLLTREVLVEGIPTASSVSAEYGGVSYVQAVKLRYIPEGHTMKPFGDNEELSAKDLPGLAPQ